MQGSINFINPNTIWHMGWGMGIHFLIHPKGWINDEWLAVHCLESVSIRLYIPSVLEISLGPCDVDDPRDISWASGNLLIVGDVQPEYIPPFDSVLYHTHPTAAYHCNGIRLPSENSIAQDCSPLITTPLRGHCIIVASLQRAKSMQYFLITGQFHRPTCCWKWDSIHIGAPLMVKPLFFQFLLSSTPQCDNCGLKEWTWDQA